MWAKLRSKRAASCVGVTGLVVLALLLPLFALGKSGSGIIFLGWLKSSRSADYLGDDSGYDLRSTLSSTNVCNDSVSPLKVFVYDFPRKFNFGMLQNLSAPDQNLPWPELEPVPTWADTGLRKQHNVEYWLLLDLIKNRGSQRPAIRVSDPEQADLFFVPFFSSLSYNKFGTMMRDAPAEIDKELQREVVSMLHSSEWWQRSGGEDHVIVLHHPNAFRSYRHLLNASIFVVADFGRNPPTVSSLAKDVVAPYTHMVPTLEEEIDDPFESRTTLLYFRGRIKRKDDGKVRTDLAMLLQNKTGVDYQEGKANVEGFAEATLGMRGSRFCLDPAGDTPSSCRLFDAIVSRCVPVIVSDRIELPFEDELNYSSFALFFSMEEVLQPGFLLESLRNVSKEHWIQMFWELKDIAPHFEFQHPTKENDAVNMLWKQLRRKLPNIKLALHRKQRLKIADWWR